MVMTIRRFGRSTTGHQAVFGSKFGNPATNITGGAATGIAWTSDGATIAASYGTSPYINAYPWSSSGFGAKYANPATLPAGQGASVAFSLIIQKLLSGTSPRHS